ncbi:hypothetical protein [Algisphaera agarilytica]|uniref:Uncharacterized protein n=1 Tax=Algisphaera agarilytica TaxID=1385975 RepID=A0A7X0LJE3_9BACT|nr:hypothetical protein [Algisphaera agarilytica]MBB6429255.1 hypothetical protein [Algisphaera agarilytica]
MALTKERKILITVAGVACGILLLDRVMLGGSMGGPTPAQAAGPSVAVVAPAAPAAVTPAATDVVALDLTGSPQDTTSLAQRLSRAGKHLPEATPDAFRPSARWHNPAPASPGAAPARPDFDPRAFADRNPLDAVYASPQGAYAMIDGQATRLGEVRDGMTLTDIGDRWVVWSGGGVKVKVHLDPVR